MCSGVGPNNSFKPTPCRGVSRVLYATLAHVRRPATGRLNSGVRRLFDIAAAHEMNRWNIPKWLEIEVATRDTECVYCRSAFSTFEGHRRKWASWEHIVNDLRIVTRENIVLCCISCNSSKGARDLEVWLHSRYCIARSITSSTVAPVVREALHRRPSLVSAGA
jgi:hypothetical protein